MRFCFFCFFSLIITPSFAGVIINGTRVVFHGDKKASSLEISNPDKIPYLIQSWIEDEKGRTKVPFFITPPLYRLDEGQSNAEQILKIGDLPEDKETLFWINIKTIPSAKKIENALQIAVKTKIKLIYRPNNLAGSSPESVLEQLKWRYLNSTSLSVFNPTPYYINFNNIYINGRGVDNVTYVPPHDETILKLSENIKSRNLSFTIINDYGGVSEKHSAYLE